MARYLCQMCYNVVTYGENHPCFYYKNVEKVYSLPRTGNSNENHDEAKDKYTENSNDNFQQFTQSVQQSISKNSKMINVSVFQSNGKDKFLPSRGNRRAAFPRSSNDAQKRNLCDISYFNAISDVQMTEVQFQDEASFTASKKIESWYRHENDLRKENNISPIVMESTGVEETTQRGSGISGLIHATCREEDEVSRQEKKSLSFNNDKMNFMDSPECVIRTDHSNSSIISGRRNPVVNPDFLSGSNEIENGKKHLSEYVTGRHNSLEMDSNLYSKCRKTASTVKQHISSETDNNAVVAPSGMCPRKKKYPCSLCPMEFNYKSNFDNHYRTHTGEKPFVCKVCEKAFTQKGHLKTHVRTHTGETPFVCKVCKEAFSQKGNLKTHIRTHTGEKPFVCEVCEKAFSQKGPLDAHIRAHTGEKPYECPVCGKAFTTSGARNWHQRKIHK